MERNKREVLKDTIFIIQKEIFNITKIEENFLLLYQYPTSAVEKFFSRVARLFGIEFKDRPDNLNKMIDMIMKQTEKNWWK